MRDSKFMIDPQKLFKFQTEASSCHEGCFRATWVVPSDLPYFEGHFPKTPILPAVAVIDASIEFLKIATQNQNFKIKINHSAKFSQPILPLHQIEIFAHFVKENTWDFEWRLQKDKQRLADLRISF